MTYSLRLTTVALLLFLSPISFGQDSTTVQDFELWTGISVKKSFLEKKLEVKFTQEFRFDDNSSHLNNFFSELGGKYEIIKGLKIGVNYRFIRNNRNSGYRNEQRFNADLSYKHNLEALTLDYRFRYQNHNLIGESRSDGDFPVSKYRLRVKVKYNIKNWKLDPYVSVEGFFAQETNSINYISSITETNRISGFEKIRFTLGTKYKINSVMEVGAYYRIEQESKTYPIFYNTPARYYSVGLNLTFKL